MRNSVSAASGVPAVAVVPRVDAASASSLSAAAADLLRQSLVGLSRVRLVSSDVPPFKDDVPALVASMKDQGLTYVVVPTVAPMPQWTSGMAATHLWTNGRLAALRSCWIAFSSVWTPRIQALTGTLSDLIRIGPGIGPDIDRLQQAGEVSHVGPAEHRHPGGHVRAYLGALGQDPRQPLLPQLAAHGVKMRRQPALVAQIRLAHQGEPGIAPGRLGPAHAVAGMAGMALEPGEGVADGPGGIERDGEVGRPGDRRPQGGALFRREMEPRHAGGGAVGQASGRGPGGEGGEGRGGPSGRRLAGGIVHLMAGGAGEASEPFPSAGGAGRIHGEPDGIQRFHRLAVPLEGRRRHRLPWSPLR